MFMGAEGKMIYTWAVTPITFFFLKISRFLAKRSRPGQVRFNGTCAGDTVAEQKRTHV